LLLEQPASPLTAASKACASLAIAGEASIAGACRALAITCEPATQRQISYQLLSVCYPTEAAEFAEHSGKNGLHAQHAQSQ
jgi:hypothetical protein